MVTLSSTGRHRSLCLQLLSSSTRHGHNQPRPHAYTRASDKLFADAVAEETAEIQTGDARDKPPVDEYPNWTGEESVQDAVLRMLVDKYKPLRGSSIRTAEEKLKSTPPSMGQVPGSLTPSSSTSEDPVPFPSNTAGADTHKPWLTTFRAPSHTTSIRHMRFPPPLTSGARPQRPPIHPDDYRARMEQRERKKKAVYAGRLTNARESSLDYQLGKSMRSPGDPRMNRPNPASVKGWTSLVEERIDRARKEGYFRSVKGRGKPLVREHEESNPFIPREEFLMNRIVQRQGAAPPWVEIQGELDTAVASFRGILQTTWTRRAVRKLTLERPPALLPKLTLADVNRTRLHDPEWEAREAGYHEEALGEINALVRKYNGVAPYSVRRTFLSRQTELERMYEVSAADILTEINRRAEESPMGVVGVGDPDEESGSRFPQGNVENGPSEFFRLRLRDMWNTMVAKVVGR